MAERCPWCETAGAQDTDLYITYHDTEWGVPEWDSEALFEKLLLDGFQAGLSWITILKKRNNFRKSFDNFDPQKMARYTEKRREKLMQDTGIVRNRLKIEAATTNAQAYLKLQETADFSDYLWNFVDGAPIQNKFKTMKAVPAETPLSKTISKDLKQKGFRFVGPTIVYAFMQAVGMVNDHITPCFRHQEVAKLTQKTGQKN
ncbi:MAG: DNA-3-methyladenine glycosylase I [Alphaproteobacteria bacterium]